MKKNLHGKQEKIPSATYMKAVVLGQEARPNEEKNDEMTDPISHGK